MMSPCLRSSFCALFLAFSLFFAGCLGGVNSPEFDPNSDSDGDGLTDGYETEFGLNPNDSTDAPACQGLVEFCLRTYDNFTFAETHNSFATSEDGVLYLAANHDTGLTAQWNGGIRAYMLDTHHKSASQTNKEDVVFCHGDPDQSLHPCEYSEVDAFAWLSQLSSFMNESPNDIVSILLENYVPIDHLEHLFNQTGLLDRTWVHSPGEPWPTLGEMVLSNRTLVIFWDEGDDTQYPWLHHAWTHSWDTPCGEDEQEDMSCDVGRGDREQPVWHLNNWLSNPLGLADSQRAEQVNDKETLLARAIECWQEVGNRPTFIAVDWWEDGDVVGVTEELNLMQNWNSSVE